MQLHTKEGFSSVYIYIYIRPDRTVEVRCALSRKFLRHNLELIDLSYACIDLCSRYARACRTLSRSVLPITRAARARNRAILVLQVDLVKLSIPTGFLQDFTGLKIN